MLTSLKVFALALVMLVPQLAKAEEEFEEEIVEGLTETEAQKKLPGFDTAKLTPKQRLDLVELAYDVVSPCESTTLGTSISKGSPCQAALRMLELAKRLLLADNTPAGALLRVDSYFQSFEEKRRATVGTNGPSKGPANTPITIVVFTDLQCPACRRTHAVLNQLVAHYPEDVRLVFHHFPLWRHGSAEALAVAATFAEEKEKFWLFTDYAFEHQDELEKLSSAAFIAKAAKALGLNPKEIRKATSDKKRLIRIQADVAEGNKLQISGTPTIFINGRQQFIGNALGDLVWSIEDEKVWIANGKTWTMK